jgi:hypothetical protein
MTAKPMRNRSQPWLEIGFLVLVAVLTFGIFVNRFGIYLDDWVTVYILERLSFWHLLDLTQGQSRPIYAVLMSIVGTTPLVSHAVTLIFLVVNLMLIRGLLHLIWPRIGFLAVVVAALYAVYPGYWFRTASMALITEISLTMALVSWILAVYSVRWRGWRRYAAAAVSMLLIPLYVLTYELPVGVEALRPLLFWALLPAPTFRERLRRMQAQWWPWGLTLVAIVLYRLVIFEPTGFYDIVNHNALARPDLASLMLLFLAVFFVQIAGVWFDPLNSAAFQDVGGLLIGAILGAGVLVLMLRRRALKDAAPWTRTLLGMLLVGLLIMVLGQATQVITMKPPLAVGWLTRWNQISMLGVVLIWCSLLMLLGRRLLRQRAMLLVAPAFAFLIAAGSAVHVRIGNFYAEDWDAYRSLWWQLAEAAPYIADNTTLLLEFPDLDYIQQRAFWPPAYQGMVAADLFFNNPRLTALHYTALMESGWLDSADIYVIDNGNWSFGWPHYADRQVLLRMLDGCLQVVDPAHLDRYILSEDVRAIAETLAPDPQQFFVDVPDGKTFPYRHLFGPPMTAGDCPSPFAIPGG